MPMRKKSRRSGEAGGQGEEDADAVEGWMRTRVVGCGVVVGDVTEYGVVYH